MAAPVWIPHCQAVAAPGRPHTFRVESESARFVAELTPPLRVADYFLELFALEDPGVREVARLARDYPQEHFYLPLVPVRLQRGLAVPYGPRDVLPADVAAASAPLPSRTWIER